VKKEYEKNGFVVIEDFLPLEVYKEIVKIFKNGEFVEINQVREERYKLWETLEDKHFPSDNEEYMAHFWSSFDVVSNPKIIRMYDRYIKPLLEKILDEKNQKVRHQATKYKNNGKNFTRIHYDDYMGSIGYILYLTELDWKYDWGGQLQIIKEGKILSHLPSPNKLIIVNHTLKNSHWVSPVSEWSKEDRNTLTGFCINKNLDLPDTWRNRKDISVIE